MTLIIYPVFPFSFDPLPIETELGPGTPYPVAVEGLQAMWDNYWPADSIAWALSITITQTTEDATKIIQRSISGTFSGTFSRGGTGILNRVKSNAGPPLLGLGNLGARNVIDAYRVLPLDFVGNLTWSFDGTYTPPSGSPVTVTGTGTTPPNIRLSIALGGGFENIDSPHLFGFAGPAGYQRPSTELPGDTTYLPHIEIALDITGDIDPDNTLDFTGWPGNTHNPGSIILSTRTHTGENHAVGTITLPGNYGTLDLYTTTDTDPQLDLSTITLTLSFPT